MFQAIKDKLLLSIKYMRDVLFYTALNCAIMPTIVYVTAYIMERFYAIPFGILASISDLQDVNFYRLFRFFLMVGCAEEGLFRYLLYDKILKGYFNLHRAVALAISAILFGAAHLSNPAGVPWTIPQATGAAFAGVLFGYVYEKRGLHMAILVHGLYDALITLVYITMRNHVGF